MILFDTHTHIDAKIKTPATFYDRAKTAGVKFLLVVGSNIESSVEAKNFAAPIPNVWFAAGIHPHEATDADILAIKELFSHEKSVAVGETGLDYYYELSGREKQHSLFKASLREALEFDLPAIIHCRDKDSSGEAYSDCFEILKDFASAGGRFVMHCFTGDTLWLEKFLSIGAYISFGGIITFAKGENVRELLRLTPLDKILLETDSPYLAPIPFRGKTNHPEYLVYTAKKAAEILSCDIAVLAKESVNNSFKLFKKAVKI
jgi:TatD DNase family protein